jgi:hypothetical protein
MGIDIYTRWDEQTEEERESQLTEAYHGSPYATRRLVPEAFETDDEEGAAIPAATLRERLPDALQDARERMKHIYSQDPDSDDGKAVLASFENFVSLIERLEAEGRNPRVIASW